jgi:hypothetical protein
MPSPINPRIKYTSASSCFSAPNSTTDVEVTWVVVASDVLDAGALVVWLHKRDYDLIGRGSGSGMTEARELSLVRRSSSQSASARRR